MAKRKSAVAPVEKASPESSGATPRYAHEDRQSVEAGVIPSEIQRELADFIKVIAAIHAKKHAGPTHELDNDKG
ncbi:MAG: hypothetical protein ABI947_26720 [Chloroflexota bacterium]